MNNLFEKFGKLYDAATISYAKKVFHLVEGFSAPKGSHVTGKGLHPLMKDPYWAGVKDVPKYENTLEWKVDLAIHLANSLGSLSPITNSSPIPNQKTVNDWFALSELTDGSYYPVLGLYAIEATFLYNQNDSVFDGFKARLVSGDVGSNLQAQYAQLLETGEFYNPGMKSIGPSSFDYSIIKHPFWDQVEKTMDKFMSDPGSMAQPLPPGSPINPDALPAPENSGGLTPTVNLPKAQVDKLVELYIGFFGRAAENAGLEYWKGDLDQLLKSGLSEDEAFVEISNNFWNAALQFSATTGYKENMSNFDFVAKVYSNVLGRPDAVTNDREGINYWVEEMTRDGSSKGEMVLKILNGAHYYIDELPNDPISKYVDALLGNRTDISLFFAEESVSGGLTGNAAIKMGVDIINRIDQNKSSVTKVKNALLNDTLYNLPEIDLVGTGSMPLETLDFS